jgi:hypothetical protein
MTSYGPAFGVSDGAKRHKKTGKPINKGFPGILLSTYNLIDPQNAQK